MEFSPEELAMYILSLTVQDPETLLEVEIARKNHYLKPSGGGFGGKGKVVGGNSNRRSTTTARTEVAVASNLRSTKEERFDKENRYCKDHKKPRNTSSEKETGFVSVQVINKQFERLLASKLVVFFLWKIYSEFYWLLFLWEMSLTFYDNLTTFLNKNN